MVPANAHYEPIDVLLSYAAKKRNKGYPFRHRMYGLVCKRHRNNGYWVKPRTECAYCAAMWKWANQIDAARGDNRRRELYGWPITRSNWHPKRWFRRPIPLTVYVRMD